MPQVTIQQAFDLAEQHHQAGRLQDAEGIYRQILAQQPGHVGAIHGLGVIALQVGRSDIAVELMRQAIALQPDFADAHSNLGYALRNLGQTDQAIDACRQAILLRPAMAEAHNNLGNALRDAGQPEKAIDAYRRGIAVKPDVAETYNNLGNVLKEIGQLDEALDAYRHAIALRPNYAEAHGNLGTVLKNTGQLDAAIDAYRRAVAMNPKNSAVHSGLVYALHFHPAYDAHAIIEEHRLWNRRHAEPLGEIVAAQDNDPAPERSLKIGYVSPDFSFHAVGRFLLPLFRRHDHRQFEITCYAQVAFPDAMTRQFQQNADRWRNIIGLSDEQAARQILEDRIDILVDLSGHTSTNRLLVFARKPAPVQVSYLGYPGATGLSAIGCRLTDCFADPPGVAADVHGESLHRLPHTNWCFEAPANAPPIGPPPATTRGCVTFGSFNNFGKVTEPMLQAWGRILQQTPGSRLLVKAAGFASASTRDRICRQFAAQRIDVSRLDLRGWQPDHQSHLGLFGETDIALDTFPYHGTTTTCEALWMGVPVITLAGQTHVSRVGVSLLSNVGLPELIANSTNEYERLAVELAKDPERLNRLRLGMRERMLGSPLMDAAQFARDIEAAYRRMWRSWCESGSAARPVFDPEA
jgi:predicted O-linked N-acetylglucosamine transferase (SPINDLY family)